MLSAFLIMTLEQERVKESPQEEQIFGKGRRAGRNTGDNREGQWGLEKVRQY